MNFEDKDFLLNYKKIPLLHIYSVFPSLLTMLGDIRGKMILDIGCGYGDLAKLLSEKGANVKGLDIAEKWEFIWKEEYNNIKNLVLRVGDGAAIESIFPNIKFDIIVMNMVLLNVPTIKKIEGIFQSVSQSMKDNGVFIFSDLHPITLMDNQTSKAEIQSYDESFSYFKDGSKFKSSVLLSDYSMIEIEDVHWTLETYSKLLFKNNLVITKIIEPSPIETAPQIIKQNRKPEHIIFECRKVL